MSGHAPPKTAFLNEGEASSFKKASEKEGDIVAKAIMVQGTASGVGKTILTLALCRIFKQDGHITAPFKAQNMTGSTCAAQDGHDEIAVSQWLQAKAAGAVPRKDMNPIVVKPHCVQTISPAEKLEAIMAAYQRLCDGHDIIVIEGAGSPVELNLNHDDMVNMGMARRAGAPVLLVSDIDRGGIFAALYGTVNLMQGWERAQVKAGIVNRFRGDTALFADGVKILEEITNLPVAGVVPHFSINLPEEDALFENGVDFDAGQDFEKEFDRIADIVRKSLDMNLIYRILNEGGRTK